MTFPSRYEPKKKNLTDKTDVTNNPTISNNNKDNEIDPLPTTIGEAVKEVIETGKEVVIQGPQTAGELTGVKENELKEEKTGKILKQGEKDQSNLDKVSKDSKLEIDGIESTTETSLLSNEEKIILNPNESEIDEAIITTVTTIPTEGVNVEAQTEFTVPLKDKQENIEVETDVQVNPTASPSSGSSFESTNIQKPILSLNDESFQQKSTSVPESDKDTINPKILLEKEDLTLQQQQQQTRKDFSSNPFITYSLFWQHIVSDWVSFYDEYLKNLIKFNGSWFEKSGNSSSSSQQ